MDLTQHNQEETTQPVRPGFKENVSSICSPCSLSKVVSVPGFVFLKDGKGLLQGRRGDSTVAEEGAGPAPPATSTPHQFLAL